MNPESLEALIIDRSFGELSPEAAELLDTFLVANPETHASVAKIEAALAATELAVGNHPALFSEQHLGVDVDQHPETSAENVLAFPAAVWLRAVASIGLLALVGASGYFAGNRSHSSAPTISGQRSTALLSSTSPTPWTQYRITSAGIEVSIPKASSGQ